MKTFNCTCSGQPTLFFESHSCTACGRLVGVTDDFNEVQPFNIHEKTGLYTLEDDRHSHYKKCANFDAYQICNGMVEVKNSAVDDSDQGLCFACQFNEIIPDLTIVEHIPLWRKMEIAKRRALFTLKALSLPLATIQQNPDSGLSFEFSADSDVNDHFSSKLKDQPAVMTGHNCGYITINIAEADDVARSKTQAFMGERYRTLLGHFRHELGHYYFDQLIVNDESKRKKCKAYFGDDQLDYQEALDKYYKDGAPANWPNHFISEYATMHPYEDWAETWAHYMHIIDTLETAQNFGIAMASTSNSTESVSDLNLPQEQRDFQFNTSFKKIIRAWIDFSVALNSLNRSMGLADAYPFVLTDSVIHKLTFIHYAIHNKIHLLPSKPNTPTH